MSLAGCRVRLYGLNTTLLNAAEGLVTGPPDPTSGRHPIVLTTPPEAVKGYPAGVKVQEKNLEVLKRVTEPKEPKAQQPSAGEPKQPKSKKQGAQAGLPGPTQWAQGLTPSQQAEWLVDCYRMRLDDDYALGGCNLHGLYDPDHDPESIAKDFLVFCKLAVRAGVIPPGWDWAAFLRTAGKLLNYAFEKSDAQDKYGSENYFSAAMGGRSLRYTGEVVYARNVMGAPVNEESSDLLEEVEEEVEGVELDGTATGQGLEDVGGIKIWKELLRQLQQ